MRYMLVLQWPAFSESDYDALVEIEDVLEENLGTSALVDGHDFGSGEMNIFVWTDQPNKTFADVEVALGSHPRRKDVRAAYRLAAGEGYTILWPPGLENFSVA